MTARSTSPLTLGLGILGLGIALTWSSPTLAFIRGDANDDGAVDVSDAVNVLSALFIPGTPPLVCADAGDVNDDGAADVSDAIYLLSHLFIPGSPPPPAPFPDDGPDPTIDSLGGMCGGGPVPGDFFTIAQGSGLGAPDGDQLITTEDDWTTFWALHDISSPPPVVDFTTDVVIVAVRSYPNGNHCIGFESGMDDGAVLTMELVHQIGNNPPCLIPLFGSRHYHFVRWEGGQGGSDVLNVNQTDRPDQCMVPCPTL